MSVYSLRSTVVKDSAWLAGEQRWSRHAVGQEASASAPSAENRKLRKQLSIYRRLRFSRRDDPGTMKWREPGSRVASLPNDPPRSRPGLRFDTSNLDAFDMPGGVGISLRRRARARHSSTARHRDKTRPPTPSGRKTHRRPTQPGPVLGSARLSEVQDGGDCSTGGAWHRQGHRT